MMPKVKFSNLVTALSLLLAVSIALIPAAFAAPTPMLNLSHISCFGDGDQVEVHFVVVNLPDGVTPLALTFTGTWPGGT